MSAFTSPAVWVSAAHTGVAARSRDSKIDSSGLSTLKASRSSMYRGTLGGIIPEKGVKSRNGFSGRVTGGGSAESSLRTSFVLKSDAARDLVAAVEKNQGFTVARFQSAGSLKL
jgi:hypothetical protein